MFLHSSSGPDLRHRRFLSRISVIAFLLTCGLCTSASATTRNVPAQYSTIQAGINASVNGDTVLIADGTYSGPGNVDLDFGGKGITVTSQNGAATTIIDCQGSEAQNHRGFYLHTGETSAVISGLTIKNGYESTAGGGGIATSDVNGVMVQNCVIKNNSAASGGGIYNTSYLHVGSITIINCTVSGNTALTGNGGGVYNENGGGTIAVTNCLVTGNAANNGSKNGGPNSTGDGGGIFNDNNSYLQSGTITVTNCVLSGNTADSGGGIYNHNSNPGLITITNCTVTQNAATVGSSVYVYNYYKNDPITLTNDILYGDTDDEIGGYNFTEQPIVTYCDVQGGFTGTGNLDVDPHFVNVPADLHLLAGSPCLGAGTATGAPTTTLDGRLRPNPPSMGAYELDLRTVTSSVVQSSLNPSIFGKNVTFKATIAGNNGPPTGTVNLHIDGVVKSTLALTNGAASYSTASLTVGPHSVYVSYSGDAGFTPGVSPTLTQTVQPVAVSSISFSPSSITGIGNLTGTLVLNNAAPSGNAIVTLSSSNPGAFYVPASAQLNAGLVSRTVTGTSRFVNVSTPVTVTATYGGVSKTTIVTINPVIATALTSLSFSPTTITGAGNVTGTLTLNGVAPANNAVVTLSSSNPNALYVPPTAQLNSGVTSRTFTATSRLVTTSTNVTVTATWAGGSKTAIVTVKPITATSIASVAFSPSSITGAGNVTGTLALNGVAPSGNAVIHLTSSNPNALFVPATAQINAGLISRTFTATARPVTSTTSVTVTATWPGASVTTTVTLHPLTISSVSFSPSSISGAGNLTGTLTLTGPAPSANAVVQLTSSNPSALFVPATAQINSGVSSRTFTAVSRAVTTSTNVTVTASWGGVSKTTIVTVNP